MGKLEKMEDSVTGYGLWREPSEAGGYRYYTDDCGVGRVVWDDVLDDPRLIFEVLDRQGSLQNWLDAYYECKRPSKE